ncbi:MAG: FtsW/RodA/SpoVE family cell cycle protein [Rikenellaceae bacterium]
MAIANSEGGSRLPRLIFGDRVLWVIVAILSIVSVLLVFSSTAKMAYDVTESASPFKYLFLQLAFLIFSLAVMAVMHRFSVKLYSTYSWHILIICILLTLYAYFRGSAINGAARWIPLGPINIQPSEALKVAIVLHLSVMLTRNPKQIKNLRLVPALKKGSKALNKRILNEGMIPITIPIFASTLVILMAHTSSAMVLFGVSLVILYLAGVRFKEILKVVGYAALFAALFSFLGLGRSGTAGGRLDTWVDTWTSNRMEIRVDDISDTERSMVAIQNGGFGGVGAGQSSMRVEMIHPESDYAFAFFVEEYGLILSILLLLLYIWIFFRAMWIFERCNDPFRELLVLSLASLILLQALLHVMVSVNFLPETGQILPLVSRGGSALFCTYMAFMLMLSISAKCEEESKL